MKFNKSNSSRDVAGEALHEVLASNRQTKAGESKTI